MIRAMVRTAVVVARRPTLWPTAVRQYRRTVPRRWWTRRPFLPVPDREYLRFRSLTQYGQTQHAPHAVDVVNYLRWCQQWERAS